MEPFAVKVFDAYRKILHPNNPKPDDWIRNLSQYCSPSIKFETFISSTCFAHGHLFDKIKKKMLLRPQQKAKKNFTICVQIGQSFVALQTGLVEIGGNDTPYSHFFAAEIGADKIPKVVLHC